MTNHLTTSCHPPPQPRPDQAAPRPTLSLTNTNTHTHTHTHTHRCDKFPCQCKERLCPNLCQSQSFGQSLVVFLEGFPFLFSQNKCRKSSYFSVCISKEISQRFLQRRCQLDEPTNLSALGLGSSFPVAKDCVTSNVVCLEENSSAPNENGNGGPGSTINTLHQRTCTNIKMNQPKFFLGGGG